MADGEVEVALRNEAETDIKRKRHRFFSWCGKFAEVDSDQSPNPSTSENPKDKQTPVNKLISMVYTLGKLSKRAYKDPSRAGLDEVTVSGNRIKHLNYDYLDESVEGVLKIELRRAKNVPTSDVLSESDPYVVFSTGWSKVTSHIINDERNPVWNSTYYLPIRKPGVIERDDQHLNIDLYDSDAIVDDYLGGTSVELAPLKKSNLWDQEVPLWNKDRTRRIGTTVTFAAQFITLKKACEELGKQKGTLAWQQKPDRGYMQVPSDEQVSPIILQPVAFVNAPTTGTQAWIHANAEKKTAVVAFRGTEISRPKDWITDLNFIPRQLNWDKECTLKMDESINQKRMLVHSGFRAAYKSAWESVLTIVESITHWSPEWTVYITGHSLGGALATLCSFEYASRHDAQGRNPNIVMMSFGAPRVGNRAFARAYQDSGHESYRVVNRLDIIRRHPIFLNHVKREVIFEENGGLVVDMEDFIRLKEILPPNVREEPPCKKMSNKGWFKTPDFFKQHFMDYYFSLLKQTTAFLNSVQIIPFHVGSRDLSLGDSGRLTASQEYSSEGHSFRSHSQIVPESSQET